MQNAFTIINGIHLQRSPMVYILSYSTHLGRDDYLLCWNDD